MSDRFHLGEAERAALRATREGDLEALKAAFANGVSVQVVDPHTRLGFLHIAVGTNNLPMSRYLAEEAKAPFRADGFGRWPSVVAAQCEVDDDLSDYIVHAEARALGLEEPRDNIVPLFPQ